MQFRLVVSLMACMVFGLAIVGSPIALGAPATRPATSRPATRPGAGYTAPALPESNPMEWHEPAAMPVLSDPLTDSKYKQRSAALHFLAAPAAETRQLVSVVVERLDPDGTAAAQGIHPGDVLVSLDGKPLLEGLQLNQERVAKGVTLGVMDKAGEVKEVTLPAGLPGIGMRTVWRPEVAWAKATAHDPRFDALVRVAAAALQSDPELAQSALARAQKTGCDIKSGGYVPAAIACLWAFQQCRFDDALAFGDLAEGQMSEGEKPLFHHYQVIAAVASFKLPRALELAGQLPGALDADTADRLKLMVAAWGKVAHPAHPNPLQELEAEGFRDASAQLISVFSKQEDHYDCAGAARSLRNDGHLKLVAPSGQYRLLLLGPTGNNADAELEFSFADADRNQTPFARNLNFGLVDSRNKDVALLKCTQYDDGTLEIGRYTDTDYRTRIPRATDGHWRVRMVMLDQRLEVIVNGRRVFYGVIEVPEHDRKLAMLIQVVGVKATIHDYTWRVAGEHKEKG